MNITQRSIPKAIILTLLTCGIYGIFWFIKMAKEAVAFADVNDSGTAEVLLMIFFFPVGIYLTEKKFAQGCAARNIPHEDRTILYIILSFLGLGLIAAAMLQSDLNDTAAKAM
jgi:hypothetical protein